MAEVLIKNHIKLSVKTFTIFMLLIFITHRMIAQTSTAEIHNFKLPILLEEDENRVLRVKLNLDDGAMLNNEKLSVEMTIDFSGSSDLSDIEQAAIHYANHSDFDSSTIVASLSKLEPQSVFKSDIKPGERTQYFWLTIDPKEKTPLTHILEAKVKSITVNEAGQAILKDENPRETHRYGKILRDAGADGVHTYRIPGLATTKNGILIAVYDIRHNSSIDLQGDVDVGMSRSFDGGETWEPMKVIMDMGEYGGLPEDENGIGDPAVLVDEETGTIWVAALWLHGHKDERAWWASDQGLSYKETGQFMLVKSEDNGDTWSEPKSITAEVKNPQWKLFFNGPGKGIISSNGALVFAAQFKDAEGVPHSTILYSKDHGATWKVGSGVKSETTEAQVVELTDGSLMLNMRDDRNRADRKDTVNGRSIYVTNDWGETWQRHPTSRSALIEPNCMASLIATDIKKHGSVLFFSNPNSRTQRDHITIKASFDDGMTWPENHQVELYEGLTYGYSCMSMIDGEYIGILYEGIRSLIFQKIPIKDLVHE